MSPILSALFFRMFLVVTLFTGYWFCTGSIPFVANPSVIISGPINENKIALTFDDGPSPFSTEKLLAILRQRHILATFFVTGEHVHLYPELVKKIAGDGHEVENHSWSHPHLVFHSFPFIRNQIAETSNVIKIATGKAPLFFRPPYGQYHSGVINIAKEQGLITVLWSDTGFDWRLPGKDRILSNLLNHLKPGAIVLLHEGEHREETVLALPSFIQQAEERGFHFVPLNSLVIHKRTSGVSLENV